MMIATSTTSQNWEKKTMIPPTWISSNPIGLEANSNYYDVSRLTNGVVERIRQIWL
jgi:hypothetical protein